jgi:predicted enzyme related to lactoylglutathione lyase
MGGKRTLHCDTAAPVGRSADMRLTYAIKFVDNMDDAVRFHRDQLALSLLFQSPGWSEFQTGDTKLALHPASEKNPRGSVQLGFGVSDLDSFFRQGQENGIRFTSAPKDVHGTRVATFLDCEGAETSVGVG